MQNFRLITSLLPYTPSATSADPMFPASNLSLYSRLSKKWAATVATGIVDVTLDVGAGKTLSGLATDPGIFLDDLNVTGIRIQANSTPSWDSPPWDQPATIAKCGEVQRYKAFLRFADLSASAVAYRYVNIRLLSQVPTDGMSYHISRIGLGPTTELLINPLYGIRYAKPQERIDTKMADGGREVNLMGPRKMLLTCQRQLAGASEFAQEQAIQAITAGDVIVLWDSARSSGGSQSAWMMRRVEDPEMTTTFFGVDETTWIFEEVI